MRAESKREREREKSGRQDGRARSRFVTAFWLSFMRRDFHLDVYIVSAVCANFSLRSARSRII